MSDDPLKLRAVPPSDPGLLAADRSARHPGNSLAGEGNVEQCHVPGANVEVPMVLRSLPEESGTEQVPQGTLSPERMREVLRRLADTTYDSAQVHDVIARRIQKDLGLSTGSEAP